MAESFGIGFKTKKCLGLPPRNTKKPKNILRMRLASSVMKRYIDIQVGMKFISGVLPNKDHRHLMEVTKKNLSIDLLQIRSVKCLGNPEDCIIHRQDFSPMSSEDLAKIAAKVSYFQWLDTEVAKILYERD